VSSKDYEKLVKETVDQYWFLLAESLGESKNERKRDLIRVLQALYYYKTTNNIQSEEFDHKMATIDFQEAENEIMKKYASIFGDIQ